MREKTLKEVCEEIGVTRRAVQGYEQAGMIQASGKNKYGYLLYDEATVEVIRKIKQHQEFGFSLKEIQALMGAPKEVYIVSLTKQLMKLKQEKETLIKNIAELERVIWYKEKDNNDEPIIDCT